MHPFFTTEKSYVLGERPFPRVVLLAHVCRVGGSQEVTNGEALINGYDENGTHSQPMILQCDRADCQTVR
jgi:hypothetical protein